LERKIPVPKSKQIKETNRAINTNKENKGDAI
jgi:hypothetical protein